MRKNEIIKGLYFGLEALESTKSNQAQIVFAEKKIKEVIKYLESKK